MKLYNLLTKRTVTSHIQYKNRYVTWIRPIFYYVQKERAFLQKEAVFLVTCRNHTHRIGISLANFKMAIVWNASINGSKYPKASQKRAMWCVNWHVLQTHTMAKFIPRNIRIKFIRIVICLHSPNNAYNYRILIAFSIYELVPYNVNSEYSFSDCWCTSISCFLFIISQLSFVEIC